MFMKTKWLALVMAVVFLVSMTGCGSQTTKNNESSTVPAADSSASGQTEDTKKEPVTITWYSGVGQASSITTGIQDDPVMNTIKEKTGVTIDHTPSLGVSDLNEKAAVLVASDDLPDVMCFSGASLMTAILKAKAAIPLDELVKTKGQDMEKNIGRALKASKLFRSDDTHTLYFVPMLINYMAELPGNNLQNGYNLRWDLYKKLNCPKITNDDEFLKVIQDMLNLEPKDKDGKPNYGMGQFFGESWCDAMIDKAHGANKGIVCVTTNTCIDYANDKVVARVTDPDSVYWESMLFYNKAYRMGLLDPESITLKYDAFADKAKSGRYMIGECNWTLGDADNQFIADGMPEKGYAPIVYGLGDAVAFGETNSIGGQGSAFISKNCKNPERVVDVLNYLTTDEGSRLILNGPEGVCYDVVNGKPVFKDDIVKEYVSSDRMEFNKKYGIGKYFPMIIRDGRDSEGNLLNYFLIPQMMSATMTPVQKDYCAYKNISTALGDLEGLPNASFDMGLMYAIKIPEGDLLKNINKAKEGARNTYVKAIIAKTEEEYKKIKDKMIADALALGYDKEVTFYNEQYLKIKDQLK